MKQLLIILALIFVVGCGIHNQEHDINESPNVTIVTIDGCEYLKCVTDKWLYVYTHKGNCRNPIHLYADTTKR